MKIDGKITILFSGDGLTIELMDSDSRIEFAAIKLNQKQVCQAFSRLACTPCKIEVMGLDKVGKIQETDTIIFPLPEGTDYRNRKDRALELAQGAAPEGWTASQYFSSQDSFSEKEGIVYAKTTIKRWVEKVHP